MDKYTDELKMLNFYRKMRERQRWIGFCLLVRYKVDKIEETIERMTK